MTVRLGKDAADGMMRSTASTAAPDTAQVTTDAVPDVAEVTTDAVANVAQVTTDAMPDAVEVTTAAMPDAAQVTTDAVPDVAEVTTDAVPDVAEVTTDAVPDVAEVTTDAVPDAVEVTTDAVPDTAQVTHTSSEKTAKKETQAKDATDVPPAIVAAAADGTSQLQWEIPTVDDSGQVAADIASAFFVKLDQFEGPIELLLALVKKTQIPIMEVHLADITDTYLAAMKELEVFDMDNAADFVTVATILVEIKVKSLLPDITDFIPDEPEMIDPETKLKLQMQSYELFKEASEKLKPREDVNRFYKNPDEGVGDFREVLSDMSLDSLLDAFAKMLHRVEQKQKVMQPRNIVKERFTVAEKMLHVAEALKIRKTVLFTELFESDYSRSEIINTFLAVLELLKRQYVAVMQEDVFQPITINYKGEGNLDGAEQS